METSAKAGIGIKTLFRRVAATLPGAESETACSEPERRTLSFFFFFLCVCAVIALPINIIYAHPCSRHGCFDVGKACGEWWLRNTGGGPSLPMLIGRERGLYRCKRAKRTLNPVE